MTDSTDTTTTTTRDDIETETRTRTRVEADIEEVTEEYEVTTCQWCEGVHPVDESVAVGVGQSAEPVERTLGTLTVRDINPGGRIFFDAADGVKANEDYDNYAPEGWDSEVDLTVTYDREYETRVPFCAYCVGEVFGIDVETALDAPAMRVYPGPDDEFGTTTGDDTTDGGGEPLAFWVLVGNAALMVLMLLLGAPGPATVFGITAIVAGALLALGEQ